MKKKQVLYYIEFSDMIILYASKNADEIKLELKKTPENFKRFLAIKKKYDFISLI